MNNITIHRDDLQKIIKFVDEINPSESTVLGAGYVTIMMDNSSGIGPVIKASTNVRIGDHYGDFTIDLTDVDSW